MTALPPAADPRRSAVPWRVADLLVLYLSFALGFLLIGAGWAGASGEVRFEDQIRWASVGTVGVILIGAGSLTWLLAGRRNVGLHQRAVTERLRSRTEDDRAAPGPAPEAEPVAPGLVASRVMTRFHRTDCPLVRGKAVRAHQLATHQRRGRVPCDICQPLGEPGQPT